MFVLLNPTGSDQPGESTRFGYWECRWSVGAADSMGEELRESAGEPIYSTHSTSIPETHVI